MQKIEQNKARDIDTISKLEALGWAVVRIWEHEDPQIAAQYVQTLANKRRGPLKTSLYKRQSRVRF